MRSESQIIDGKRIFFAKEKLNPWVTVVFSGHTRREATDRLLEFFHCRDLGRVTEPIKTRKEDRY